MMMQELNESSAESSQLNWSDTNTQIPNASFSSVSHADAVFYPLVKQPMHMIVVYAAAYSIIIVVAFVGNCLVIGVVWRSLPTRSVINYFIVNLAVADLLVCTLCLPISLFNNIFSGWRFGAVLCKLTPFLQGVAVNASANTFAAISVDRYLAICHALKLRVTRTAARLVILYIWILSIVLLSPWAFFYRQESFTTPLQTVHICRQVWPSIRLERAYFIGVIVVSCYTIPLLLVTVFYALIGFRVWHRDAPGVANAVQMLQQSKIQVVKMLIILVVLFAFLWLPLYAIQTRFYFGADLDVASTEFHILTGTLVPVAQWLGLSSCGVNPIVYFLFSGKFRTGFVDLVRCCLGRPAATHAIVPGGPFGSSYTRYGRRRSSSTTRPPVLDGSGRQRISSAAGFPVLNRFEVVEARA